MNKYQSIMAQKKAASVVARAAKMTKTTTVVFDEAKAQQKAAKAIRRDAFLAHKHSGGGDYTRVTMRRHKQRQHTDDDLC